MNFIEAKMKWENGFKGKMLVNGGETFTGTSIEFFNANFEVIEEDDWNLANTKVIYSETMQAGRTYIPSEEFKTFIQKIKEDVDKCGWHPAMYGQLTKIINKRAGDL